MSKLPIRGTPERDPLSPLTKAILALIQALLPAMTAIVGGLWVAFTYLDHQKETRDQQLIQASKDNRTRMLEARKPFIDKQLALYIETAQVAGRLVSVSPPEVGSGTWRTNFDRFEQLYWAELSMVEDEGVKEAMQEFAKMLRLINNVRLTSTTEMGELKQLSYGLARALRSGIEKTWDVDLGKTATK
jgi:hypothetical protein